MYLHRADRDEAIRYLADKYPACFFEDPNFRRPLKHNILDDLEKERVLDRAKLVPTIDWYESHFVYRRGIIAGAERVGLDGKKAGTVTEAEQRASRAWIAARKKEMAEAAALQANVGARVSGETPATAAPRAPTIREPELNGHDMINKTPTPALHPSLAELQSALAILSGLLTEKQYEPLRPALATAALKEIVGKAERLIGGLQSNEA